MGDWGMGWGLGVRVDEMEELGVLGGVGGS